jgi:soluble lytic murein transglycosylase
MKPMRQRKAPDRDASAMLSSVGRRIATPAVLIVSIAAAAAAATLVLQPSPTQTPTTSVTTATAPGLPPRTDPLWAAIDTWNALRRNDRLSFAEYANFMLAHPGWPGEAQLRRVAERQIVPDGPDAALIATFFTRFPPTTAAGRVRYAEALATLGRADEARAAAGRAWTSSALAPDDEARLTGRFQFTPAEQDQRMERLLWDRSTASALRLLPSTSPLRQPVYQLRLAYQTRAADAATQGAVLGDAAQRDPGVVVDKAAWLRDTSQSVAARTSLAAPRTLDRLPLDPEKYLEALLTAAKGAAHDNQGTIAYDIAAQADGAVAPGFDLRAAPLGIRDDYTSLVWLGGWTALKQLNRPRDAERMFARYAAAAQTPGSQAKGHYWAGRAAQLAGDQAAANGHFASAAAQVDQFYGQLATERLGRPVTVPPDPPAPIIPLDRRATFAANDLVRAVRLLGEQRQWQDQTQFVRKIAADASTDVDHILVAELAKAIARPDLGVIVSRNARASGARDPIRTGFPTVPIPAAWESHWTMIHAIARQESQFDREALSPVGARGLVQLMPATAREQAGKLGLPWDPARLTSDIGYNVMIGSSFFDRMLTYYQGNYVLAVASYNAGPGNVNKFIRANGDPRTAGIDVVDWIEAIPLTETRAYVQKVLENAVVYDLFNPERARTPAKDRLSFYLGKKSAG